MIKHAFPSNSTAHSCERARWTLQFGRAVPAATARTVAPMRTMKLRTYQRPSLLMTLLDSLVMSQTWVSPGAPRVTDRNRLPSRLQTLASRAVAAEGTWRAWVNYDGVRLFTCSMCMDVAREHGHPALRVIYYDDKAHLQGYGLWLRNATGAWERCELPPHAQVNFQYPSATAA